MIRLKKERDKRNMRCEVLSQVGFESSTLGAIESSVAIVNPIATHLANHAVRY